MTTRCHSVFSLRSPVALSRQVSDVATLRLAIGRPSWVRRISGSLPRFPTRITLFTLPAMHHSPLENHRAGACGCSPPMRPTPQPSGTALIWTLYAPVRMGPAIPRLSTYSTSPPDVPVLFHLGKILLAAPAALEHGTRKSSIEPGNRRNYISFRIFTSRSSVAFERRLFCAIEL